LFDDVQQPITIRPVEGDEDLLDPLPVEKTRKVVQSAQHREVSKMLDLFPTAQTDEPYDFVAERRIFLHFVKELPGSIAAPDDEGVVHPYSGD
jgi:hypothetical protein